MLAVGLGLEQAESVTLIPNWLTPMLEQAPPWLLVFVVYGISLLLQELLRNNAVAAHLPPFVFVLARHPGTYTRPLGTPLDIMSSAAIAPPPAPNTSPLD